MKKCQRSDGAVYPYTRQRANRSDMTVIEVDRSRKRTNAQQGNQTDLESMTKDELAEYAHQKHGVDLDKRRSRDQLADQVRELESGEGK